MTKISIESKTRRNEMGKDSTKNIDWSKDVREGMKLIRDIKDINKDLKDAADNLKINATDK